MQANETTYEKREQKSNYSKGERAKYHGKDRQSHPV